MLKRTAALVLGLLASTLLGNSFAFASSGGVRDNGDFFSEPVKKEASRKISELEQQYKKDLVVETFTVIQMM